MVPRKYLVMLATLVIIQDYKKSQVNIYVKYFSMDKQSTELPKGNGVLYK